MENKNTTPEWSSLTTLIMNSKTPITMEQMVNLTSITGLVIDVSQMEGSGGGQYPAVIFSNGKYVVTLTQDIGEAAYEINEMCFTNVPSYFPENIFVFFMSDEQGPSLHHLRSGLVIDQTNIDNLQEVISKLSNG